MSELEAPRRDERRKWWEETNAYGRAKAAELGLSEADVVAAVNEVRNERRLKQRAGPPTK